MQRTTAVSTSTARDILRRARRQQRLTQSQLADRAGVTKTVVARYESGQQPTVAALERLVAACGYELEWTLRNAGGASHATGGTVTEPATGPAFGAAQFPGPIGRRLSAHLGEILDLLEAAGATDPRLYGAVAEGCEGVASDVLIGVTLPAGANPRSVMPASGRIGLLIDARVRVLAHHRVVDYGDDGPGIALTSGTTPPTRRSA